MKWISTTENDCWKTEQTLSANKGCELVIGAEIGKPIFGWGCCISEICAKAILNLEQEKKDYLFDALFSPDGCGFNYCRLSIGANDFAESWYSYDETDGDYEMSCFSIDRDRKYIIPAIHEAQKRSPELAFFASPWSPPTWMKFPKVCNYGKLIQTPENLKAYSVYFRKFLEAYRAEGVNITQVCPQNEFFSDQKFPSCVYNEEELENFIANYLIDEIGDMVDIYFGTVNGPDPYSEHGLHNEYLNRIMQNPKCRANIKGAAYQWCGKYAVMQAKEDFPDLNLIQSECQCGDGNNSWDHAMYTYHLVHHYFYHGVKANVYWNMALENGGLSTWGWRQNSLISVEDDDFTFNPEFYLMKHFAHFVKRGAVMMSTKGEMSSNSTVFKNPDGSVVGIFLNPFPFDKTITIGDNSYTLRPRSFNTIVLEG